MFNKLDDRVFDKIQDVAFEYCRLQNVSFASLRIEEIHTQYLAMRDNELETDDDMYQFGMGIALLKNNAFGFASGVAVDVDSVKGLVDKALQLALLSISAGSGEWSFHSGKAYADVKYRSRYNINPVSVPKTEKIDILRQYLSILTKGKYVDHVFGSIYAAEENKFYADTFGTSALQNRVRFYPAFEATAILDDGGDAESIRTNAPPVATGYEYLSENRWDFDDEIAKIPQLLEEKIHSPMPDEGYYDVVIDPTNLWLTIHESIGHATELDRAMGYEAAYAGTSFATPDLMGTLRYGSPIMNVVGDRTSEFGLASTAIDDEGVKTTSFDIIRSGVLTGFQTSRATAGIISAESNGCAYADSPLHVPIQRMANVSLQPSELPIDTKDLISGVENGFYIVGDKSWSIDMQRYNFQFSGQIFFRIKNGQIAGQLKRAAYQGNTVEFWNHLTGLGGKDTYLLAGALNCGKGQPGQVAPVSHGCPSALFRNVRVIPI